ncbi:MAG: hypothetical protein Q3983_06310 [Capnocytophaga sp.]|nr:hypothetical protein [Capnocytophaga sp.]
MKYIYYILGSCLALSGCNKITSDPIEEDYKSLFPFKGIEKPESSYEDMNTQICNPSESLENYRYKGVEIADKRKYIVTIKCLYEDKTNYKSTYYVRFIDENKQLISIGSREIKDSYSYYMENGKEFVKSFEVSSGYPMYLLVNGGGERESHIKASISAVSVDGLVNVPILSTEQYQNEEGPNPLPSPFCEYIILP